MTHRFDDQLMTELITTTSSIDSYFHMFINGFDPEVDWKGVYEGEWKHLEKLIQESVAKIENLTNGVEQVGFYHPVTGVFGTQLTNIQQHLYRNGVIKAVYTSKESQELSFDDIESCFPDNGSLAYIDQGEHEGWMRISAQGLHDLARNAVAKYKEINSV